MFKSDARCFYHIEHAILQCQRACTAFKTLSPSCGFPVIQIFVLMSLPLLFSFLWQDQSVIQHLRTGSSCKPYRIVGSTTQRSSLTIEDSMDESRCLTADTRPRPIIMGPSSYENILPTMLRHSADMETQYESTMLLLGQGCHLDSSKLHERQTSGSGCTARRCSRAGHRLGIHWLSVRHRVVVRRGERASQMKALRRCGYMRCLL